MIRCLFFWIMGDNGDYKKWDQRAKLIIEKSDEVKS